MKTFNEFLTEQKENEIPEFFAHYRSSDKNHNPHSKKEKEKEEEPEVFAHYRSGKDEKHNPLDENFKFTHDEESRAELKRNVKSLDHHKKLTDTDTDDERVLDDIFEYTHHSSDLNGKLIKNRKLNAYHKRQVESLDSVTKNPKNAFKKPIKSYAGVSEKFGEILSKVKPGAHVKSSAYISTSLNHNTARNFSENDHFIQFHLPKGYSKGRYIHGQFHANPGEHELLLARGQKFRKIKQTVVKRKNGDEATIHHLEPV